MEIRKRFVKVEYLALRKAIALMEEAGIKGYLSFHELVSEEGFAQDLSHYSKSIEDKEGTAIASWQALSLIELGLHEDEVGELLETDEISSGLDTPYLERHYQFIFNDSAHNTVAVSSIIIRKEKRESDWAAAVEVLFKTNRSHTYGLDDTVIYRDWRTPRGLALNSYWEIRNLDLVRG